MTYGKDDRGNLFRVMWERWPAQPGLDAKAILGSYDNLFPADVKVQRIQGGIPVAAGTLFTSGNVEPHPKPDLAWPWISGARHELLEYTTHVKIPTADRFHRTMVWN